MLMFIIVVLVVILGVVILKGKNNNDISEEDKIAINCAIRYLEEGYNLARKLKSLGVYLQYTNNQSIGFEVLFFLSIMLYAKPPSVDSTQQFLNDSDYTDWQLYETNNDICCKKKYEHELKSDWIKFYSYTYKLIKDKHPNWEIELKTNGIDDDSRYIYVKI